MSAKLRRFAQARLAEQSSSKSGGVMSLREIEDLFVKKLCEKCNLVERDIARVFRKFDKDNSGYLSVGELADAIHLFLNGVQRNQVQELVSHYDVDGDGSISLEEFTSFLISRSSPNPNDWLTVDTLMAQDSPGKKAKGGKFDSNAFDSINDNEKDTSFDSIDNEKENNEDSQGSNTPQSVSYKSTVFLQNMKALLLKRAQELRVEGKIPIFDRLSNHINPLAESTARSMLNKAFRPYMKTGTRVDLPSFGRVLSKFTYPGSPPPRRDVMNFLFELCSEGHEKADPDLLIDMLFDKGGIKINRFGFAQEYSAPTDTGRPAVGKGPFVRRDGDVAPKNSDVPYRVITPQSQTALAAPSDFNAALIDRSAHLPNYDIVKDHVYGINLNLYSGEPVMYLNGSKQEVLYSCGCNMVIHDLNTNGQVFFEGHDDDITCFTVSNDGALVASGQLGKTPEVLVWETALNAQVSTLGNCIDLVNQPVGLVTRVGKGFFERGVCATAFSHDARFICAIGCDDKHDMGIWDVSAGDLLANMVTAQGVPPQIKSLSWSPSSYQDTSFIEKGHEECDCDLIVTGGDHNYLRFWSFKRPNRSGIGAELVGRGHRTGKELAAPPMVHTSVTFIPKENDDDPVAMQYNCLTAGDNGVVYLWSQGACIKACQALVAGDKIHSLQYLSDRSMLLIGGEKGAVMCLDASTLDILASLSVTGKDVPCGSGPVRKASVLRKEAAAQARKPYVRPDIESSMKASGRTPHGAMAMAGKPNSVAAKDKTMGAMTTGIFDQNPQTVRHARRPPTAVQAKEKSKWKGPAQEKEVPCIPRGVRSVADVYGITVVYDAPGSGADKDSTLREPYMVCSTGYGKLIKLDVPLLTRRGLEVNPEPETVLHYHHAPLWAVAKCPYNMTMAQNISTFVSGGDDGWLCLWNAESKNLIVRSKARGPIRCISVDQAGKCFALGFVGGGFSLFSCDTSNSAVKKLKSLGKAGAAFKRATELNYEVNLTEMVHRRDCIEDISDIKFSPNGKMLAVASHDGYIDV